MTPTKSTGDLENVDERMTTRRATRTPEGTVSVLASSEAPRIRTEVMHFSTNHGGEFWDISDMVRDVVARSGVGHGQVTVHTPHTTTSIILNESETGFLNDYRRVIEEVVPVQGYYEHDDHELRTENLQEDEFINGHAHVRQMMIGSASVTVPVVDGQVLLGTWQKVLYVELDQARERKVIVHAQGI